ncbi:hypothetical protein V8E54_001177 [Elaphomyces granulatus]
MKVSIISTIVATLLAASSAAPFDTPCQSQPDALRQHQIDALRQWHVRVMFCSAETGGCFTQEFPNDDKIYPICETPVSISHIQVQGSGRDFCTFTGTDGGHTEAPNLQSIEVRPPQRQVSGSCIAYIPVT